MTTGNVASVSTKITYEERKAVLCVMTSGNWMCDNDLFKCLKDETFNSHSKQDL